MMTSSNGKFFRLTGLLCVKFIGHRWFPLIKGQGQGPLIFSLICAWTNGWANNRDAGDLRHHRAHYHVTVQQNSGVTGDSTRPDNDDGHVTLLYRSRHMKWLLMENELSPDSSLTHLPEQMAAILADDIFKSYFLNDDYRIVIQISLKFVPRSPIDNKPALV